MKRTTIIIDGKPFTYDDESEDISYATNKPITEEDAKSLLQTTKKLFDECGMKFYLCFGTLLGAIRDNGLIKGDEDVDVFVESEEILRKNLPYLQENGLKLCRINNHHFYSFHTENKSYIDVYIKRDLPNSIWKLWCCSINNGAYPKRFFKKYTLQDNNITSSLQRLKTKKSLILMNNNEEKKENSDRKPFSF